MFFLRINVQNTHVIAVNIHCNHISKQGNSVFFWINCDEYFSLVSKMLLLFLLQNNHMSIFTHSPQSRRYFCTLALFSNIFFTMSIFCISYPKRHVTTNYIKIEIEPFPCSSFPQSLSIFHRILFSFIIHSLASHHIAILILLNE